MNWRSAGGREPEGVTALALGMTRPALSQVPKEGDLFAGSDGLIELLRTQEASVQAEPERPFKAWERVGLTVCARQVDKLVLFLLESSGCAL